MEGIRAEVYNSNFHVAICIWEDNMYSERCKYTILYSITYLKFTGK